MGDSPKASDDVAMSRDGATSGQNGVPGCTSGAAQGGEAGGGGGCGGVGKSTPGPDDQGVPRLYHEGYGLEVQGYDHRITGQGEAKVFLPRDTRYRIRLSNGNDHMSMVTIDLDGYTIGTFMLHPFTKCDLERPTDRPLGFTFLQPPPEPQEGQVVKRPSKKAFKKQQEKEKTTINATFKPENGGKIIQIDVTATSMNKTQRMEMLSDITVAELFEEIKRDFGEWTAEPSCALIHWTTAEYDSPTEDVLRSDLPVLLRTFRRQEDGIRKMALVSISHVDISLDDSEPMRIPVDGLATFHDLTEALQPKLEAVTESGKDQPILHFLSETGRLLGTSNWVKGQTLVYQLMHKDEILAHPGSIVLQVRTEAPTHARQVITRMLNSVSYELEVVPETTVRECRYQLESRGGPWGEDPRWLFGGTLLHSGRSIAFYDIGHRNIIDVVPKVQDQCEIRTLEMRDPISVDGDKPVNTAEMIRREESRNRAAQEKKKRTPIRGGTTLRGRTKQQYIEVDPIEVDDRFFETLSISIFPKEQEEVPEAADSPPKPKTKTCVVS